MFQEVAQQNDFGKDAYVDIGEGGAVTFLCAALQVKSGTSYRIADGDYFIPVDGHAHNWRYSTVPIFGLVYDPNDALMRWVDVTGHLRANPGQQTGKIPVSREAILTEESLRGAFTSALAVYAGRFGAIATSLLAAGELQTDAVYDAWALGRSDAKYLLIIRRFILDYEPPRAATGDPSARACRATSGHLLDTRQELDSRKRDEASDTVISVGAGGNRSHAESH